MKRLVTKKGQILLTHNLSRLLLLSAAIAVTVTVLVMNQKDNEESLLETIIVPSSTPNFEVITDVDEKKQAFFDFLTPFIKLENQRITQERKRLIAIERAFQSKSVSTTEVNYAKTLGERYYSTLPNEGITQAWLNEILIKVNVLPYSLVLTQAANESAWGTSRFATQANNYFGQWCYRAGCGLVPLKRVEGATHEVAKFGSAGDSVHGYFMNVNRNRAYARLRSIRAGLVSDDKALMSADAAMALTQGLLSYSERGQDYVADLQAMIRANNKFWAE